MDKRERTKRIIQLVEEHGEVVVFYADKWDRERKRKIRRNGDCFVSYLAMGYGAWTKFAMSCFLLESDKRKCLRTTMTLMNKHDGRMLIFSHVEVNDRRIEL